MKMMAEVKDISPKRTTPCGPALGQSLPDIFSDVTGEEIVAYSRQSDRVH